MTQCNTCQKSNICKWPARVRISKCCDFEPIPKPTPFAAADAFLRELERAEAKHPTWPSNTLEQVAILAGEAGECLQAALHYVEGRGDIERVRAEAIQTGAMAIRVLVNLEGK